MTPQEFQNHIWDKGRQLYRDMPWRQDTRPYYILVSELMLQQTQVDRVIPKFNDFIAAFPDEKRLASASLSDVLIMWSGLGYNRRAKYLHAAAKAIVEQFDSIMPDNREALRTLPGVGPNTAGAIMAYAFNQPVAFVETNIRTVYFHHFFGHGEKVHDKELIEHIKETLDTAHPREFYWAVMDYGSWLKKQGSGRLQQSTHYKKQRKLKGSLREVRGQIIRYLATDTMTESDLRSQLDADERFVTALNGLIKDGLVTRTDTKLHLTK